MDLHFLSCDVNRAGWLRDINERLVVIDMGHDDFLSITIDVVVGTWSGTIIHVHYANSITGPWEDFTDQIRFNTTTRTAGLLAHVGRYVRCEVTTTAGAECRCDVYMHSRQSGASLQTADQAVS